MRLGGILPLVIDTNILLSGLLWHGPPRELLNKVRDGVADLVLSPALIAEFAEVIPRPKFAAILARSGHTPDVFVAELRRLVDVVSVPPLPRPICCDPEEDAVLACALAARAELIGSGDDDLLAFAMFENIPIVAVATALARFAP